MKTIMRAIASTLARSASKCNRRTSARRTGIAARRPRHSRLALERLEVRSLLASWVAGLGGAGNDSVGGQTLDPAGNMYVSGTADTGFVAKYGPDGSLAWTRSFPSGGSCVFSTEGSANYLYVSGGFFGSADFGGAAGTLTASSNQNQAFVAKLDATTGVAVWAKSYGEAFANGLAVAGGNVIQTGAFRVKTDFDPGAGKFFLTPPQPKGNSGSPLQNGYVLILNASNGSFSKAWQIGGTGHDTATSVDADGSTLFVTGLFSGNVDFDPGAAVKSKTSAGASSTYLASYSLTGSLNWVQDTNGLTGYISGDANSLYLSGDLVGSLDADPGPGTTVLTSAGLHDVFTAKYSKATGGLVWASRYGAADQEVVWSNYFDAASGTLYVGGTFAGNSDFNPAAPGGEVTSAGSYDGYLLTIDAATGAYQNVVTLGGTQADGKVRVAGVLHTVVDDVPYTTVFAAGRYTGTASFPTGDTLTGSGGDDIFLMGLQTADPAPTAVQSDFESATDAALLSLLGETTMATTKRK